MGSAVRTTAGTTFEVSTVGVASTFDNLAASFAALSYTKVGEISDLGSFGKKYNLVSFSPIGNRNVIKRKGSANNGTMQIKMGSAPLDGGQVRLQAAAASDSSYAFRIVTQSGSTYYFTGQVMGFMLELGSVDQIMGASTDIELDNDIVAVGLAA